MRDTHSESAAKADASAFTDAVDAFFAARAEGIESEPPQGPVADLLAQLDAPVMGDDAAEGATLVDVTMLRIERDAGELASADADAIDRWMDHADGIGTDAQQRVGLHDGLAELLAATPVTDENRASLVDATLARIESAEAERNTPFSFAQRVGSIRWADVVSVAAKLLIGASVARPVLDMTRARADRVACAGNLTTTAGAMGAYANDNRDALPMAIAGFGGNREWIRVGDPERSNSANLHTLINADYARRADLACAGNPSAPVEDAPGARDWSTLREVSYSYQLPIGRGAAGQNAVWRRSGSAVVLADRSPVILRAVAGQPVNPNENSPNHTRNGVGIGQHMLLIDGSTQWATSPVLASGDNIWLPRGIEAIIDNVRIRTGLIEGSELPSGPEDAFLAP